jgi:glycosyltransferase involved in cell wall biosynthesis
MATVAIDARDAAGTEPRGWGRYVSLLVTALRAGAAAGLELRIISDGGPGPELVFEQLRLPRMLRSERISLVHAPNCFLPVWRPCPGVVTIHDLAFEVWPDDFARATRLKYQAFTRLAARSAQRIICPSSYTREDLISRYGTDPSKIRVIAEAPALATGHEPAPAGPYVLAVGDLRRKKNFGALVEAFVALRRGSGIPHRLVLAGVDGGEGPRLRALAAGEPVEITGYIGDGRLDALIRGAELLVNPSLYEGFGLVVLEAMARGTPVLAAAATALPETGAGAAAYFTPAEPESLRDSLESLLGDAQRRAELRQCGIERARAFSWQRTALQTADVYRELL